MSRSFHRSTADNRISGYIQRPSGNNLDGSEFLTRTLCKTTQSSSALRRRDLSHIFDSCTKVPPCRSTSDSRMTLHNPSLCDTCLYSILFRSCTCSTTIRHRFRSHQLPQYPHTFLRYMKAQACRSMSSHIFHYIRSPCGICHGGTAYQLCTCYMMCLHTWRPHWRSARYTSYPNRRWSRLDRSNAGSHTSRRISSLHGNDPDSIECQTCTCYMMKGHKSRLLRLFDQYTCPRCKTRRADRPTWDSHTFARIPQLFDSLLP